MFLKNIADSKLCQESVKHAFVTNHRFRIAETLFIKITKHLFEAIH